MQRYYDYTPADSKLHLRKATGSQIPTIQPPEESYYVKRVFPQVSPSDIPQPEGKIYRG